MKLTISGMDKGSTKDIVNHVVWVFNRINEPETPIHIVIEDEKDDD